MSFVENLNTAMSNPMFGLGVGLLSGAAPGGTFASGAQRGLLNFRGMQQSAQQQQMNALAMQKTQMALDAAEEQKERNEKFVEAQRSAYQQAGLLGSDYAMSDDELFPGESPSMLSGQNTQGLLTGTEDPATRQVMNLIQAAPETAQKEMLENLYAAQTGGGAFSKTPTMVMGPNGLEIWQMNAQGGMQQAQLPEGRSPVMPVTPLDTGGGYIPFGKYQAGGRGTAPVGTTPISPVGAQPGGMPPAPQPAMPAPSMPAPTMPPPVAPAPRQGGFVPKTLGPAQTPEHAANIIEAEEGEKSRMGRLTSFETDMDVATSTLSSINRTKEELAHLAGITDAGSAGWGTLLKGLPESDAMIWDQVKTTVQSQLGLEKMAELKALSSTGSTGFGALNEKELDLLVKHLGALEQATGPKEIKRVIGRITSVLEGKESRMENKIRRQAEFYKKHRESLGDMGLTDAELYEYWPVLQPDMATGTIDRGRTVMDAADAIIGAPQ
jgi:hypothetical protein